VPLYPHHWALLTTSQLLSESANQVFKRREAQGRLGEAFLMETHEISELY
jgi:hypothetical protein